MQPCFWAWRQPWTLQQHTEWDIETRGCGRDLSSGVESCGKEAGGSKMPSSPGPCFPRWAVTKLCEAVAKEMLPEETWKCGGFFLGGYSEAVWPARSVKGAPRSRWATQAPQRGLCAFAIYLSCQWMAKFLFSLAHAKSEATSRQGYLWCMTFEQIPIAGRRGKYSPGTHLTLLSNWFIPPKEGNKIS